jgi:DNA-binding transcriptional LysR family regulator
MASLDRLEEFLSVAKTLSFTAAARQLSIPRATLSRRVASLEEELGQPLFLRSTRGLTLSGAGETLFESADAAVKRVVQACDAVRQLDGKPRGRLRISVPDSEAAAPELFAQFAADYPEVILEVSVSPHRVDLVRDGIDVAVRFGEVGDENLVGKKLWSAQKVLVANDTYLKHAPCLRHPDDLIRHRAITSISREGYPEQYWPLFDGGRTEIRSGFAASDLKLRIEAACLGLGIALLPRPTISSRIEKGELVPLLESVVGSASPAHLVYAQRARIPLAMRLFLDRAAVFYGSWGSA